MTRRQHCELRTTSDGTPVRVQGDIEQPLLDQLADAVRKHYDSRCHALSDVPMPELAQKLHGRETYWCDRDEGHEPPHRWPEHRDAGRDRAPIEWWP